MILNRMGIQVRIQTENPGGSSKSRIEARRAERAKDVLHCRPLLWLHLPARPRQLPKRIGHGSTVTRGGGRPLTRMPESCLAQDDCVIDGAEWVVLDGDLVKVACMSMIETTRAGMRTHREDQSSVREHVTLRCPGRQTCGLQRLVVSEPIGVPSILGV
jgi:hypothetical protein